MLETKQSMFIPLHNSSQNTEHRVMAGGSRFGLSQAARELND